MDPNIYMITMIASVCIMLFGMAAVVGSIYGILVWYPARRQKKVEALKASGRQGEATILRLPDQIPRRSARAVFTRVPIGLDIRVMGIEPYEVGSRPPQSGARWWERWCWCGWTPGSRATWTG